MKTNKYRILLSLFAALLGAVRIWGAAITMNDLPYLCDFEDETENAAWVLNPSVNTITTANRWVIGDAVAYTGAKSLYVSQDAGASNTYASTNNVLLAYRDITLEAGDYDIAYDWSGLGNKTKGYVKVVYANRPTSNLACLGNSTEPAWVSSATQLMGESTSLYDGDSWRHVQARVSIPVAQANKTTTRLLFVWVNTDVAVKDSITSIAIDNFQLAKASPTDYPDNIHVSTLLNQATVTWEGALESYEVMYRKKTDNSFTSLPVTDNSVTLTDVEYGSYEFWVCGVNGEDKSVYTVFPLIYIYPTDCFDALNLYNASFEYGTWNHRTGHNAGGYNRIDYGASDIRSRHTTHFDLTEADPRTVILRGRDTLACLRTVPAGEYGSLRLGNWGTGSQYESVTFTYTVEEASMAVLLIQYAIVLENPDHGEEEQPRFTLDVFGEDGKPIDTKCASVDFHSPTQAEWNDPEVRALWHSNTWMDGNSAHAIMWQDWKTIGISMEDYVGQTLTITFTSYDCDQGGHFGYAYFMLNCTRSDVDGLPWGEGSSTQMFTAPEGFDYAWFNRTDVQFKDTITNTDPAVLPYITDNGRFFYVQEADTNTYLCHVTYPTNKECGYWFDASAKPHNPKAEMELRWTPSDCRNGYTWWNRCHVMLTNQQTGEIEHRYDKQMESCFLILEDGTEIPVKYDEAGTYVPMPDEGGTVRYGIWTGIYINNELFADTAWYELEVPAIGPLETHLYDTVCRGQSVVFPEGSHDKYSDSGDYTDNLVSVVTGCDSTVILHLTVHEPVLTEVYDTICEGGSYDFNGRILTTPGRQTAMVKSLVTGCDSIITLYLAVAPRPVHSLVQQTVCADEPLLIQTTVSDYVDSIRVVVDAADSVYLGGRDGDIAAFYMVNVLAGPRTAVIYSHMPWCEELLFEDTVQFNVSLPSSIVEARFDDVLAFLAPEYANGYVFSSFRWFINGVELEDEKGSWLYMPDLDKDAQITVSATLLDGTVVWVCPFTFNTASRPQALEQTETEAGNKVYKILQDGQLFILCNGHKYNVLGQEVQ